VKGVDGMKLSVVYDQEGNILAANWVVEGGDSVEAGEGETVAEFDPPEDMARRLEAVRLEDRDARDPSKRSVDELLAETLAGVDQLRVDVDANMLQQR
jgi:hypothetical protein